MATPQPSQTDEPPYPSFTDLQGDRVPVTFTDATKRLFWPLDGEFPAAISVMKSSSSPDSLEPLFQPDPAGNSGTWHEISQLPLTEPKVSSVPVSVYDLVHWESSWMEQHREHVGNEFITYGEMNDEDRPYAQEMDEDGNYEADSDTKYLVACCGENRPLQQDVKLVVQASPGNCFVTVLDYVSAVHPWLMSLRKDISLAQNVTRGNPASFPTEFIVNIGQHIMLQERVEWVRRTSGAPPTNPLPVSFMNRLRAARVRGEVFEVGVSGT